METLAHLELEVIAQTAEPDEAPDPAYQEAYDAIAEMAAETINYEDED